MLNAKARAITIIVILLFIFSSLIGIGIYLIIDYINKSKALTSETNYNIGNMISSTNNNVIDPNTYQKLMSALGNDTTSTRNKSQINGGTPIVFQMGEVNGNPVYWEVVYQTGDAITVWMTQPYSREYYNSSGRTQSDGMFNGSSQTNYSSENGYSRSTIRQATLQIYNELSELFPLLKEIVKNPNDAGVSSWQYSQNNSCYSSASCWSITNGLGSNPNNGSGINNSNPNNWTWEDCMSDMFWIPSHYEVCNTSTTEASFNGGLWGLTTADLAFNPVRLDTNTSSDSYCWLRSGGAHGSSVKGLAVVVGSAGSVGDGNVGANRGIRPACHISLDSLKKNTKPTIIMESSGYPSKVGGLAGGFENTGWSGTYDTAHVRSGDYAIKISATADTPEITISTTNIVPIDVTTQNHVFYFQYWGYQEIRTEGWTQVYWPIEEPSMGVNLLGPAGQWNMYSFYGTRSDNALAGGQQVRIDFDNSYQVGTIWFDDFLMLDLTEIFGSGNEPSKEWCDANIISGTNVQSFEVGESVTLQNKSGIDAQIFDFLGWSTTPKMTSSSTQTVEYSNGATVSNIIGTITFYGVWDYKSFSVNVVGDTNAGTVSGGGSYKYGTSITLSATANNGYEFVGWDINGDSIVDNTNNPYTFTVTNNITITALFKQLMSITIRTNNAEFGQILLNNNLQNSITIFQDTNTQIANVYAIPKANCTFLYWYDESTGSVYTDNPLNYTVTQSTTLTAYFGSGLVKGVAVSVEQIDGTNIAAIGEARITGYNTLNGIDYIHFSAVAYTGYRFVGWRVDGEILSSYGASADIPYSIVENKQVFAVFAPIENQDNVNDDIDNGQGNDFV